MYLDPTLINWLFFGAATVCGFMIGKLMTEMARDQIINDTIVYLIENNFIKAKKANNGEWEILELDQE